MSHTKKMLLALLLVFIAIQFIQPARNKSGQVLPADVSKLYAMPQNVATIFRKACYDCHSNNTNYPWYVNVQPMGWVMAKHIQDGKAEINFSGFGNYSGRRQVSKLKNIANTIKDGTMPLQSYTWLHADARLTANEKAVITSWITKTKDSLENKN
jgi:hypothetical protein